jgi:hypothetical protein
MDLDLQERPEGDDVAVRCGDGIVTCRKTSAREGFPDPWGVPSGPDDEFSRFLGG